MLGADEVLHHGQGDEHQDEGDDEKVLLIKAGGRQTQRAAEALVRGVLEQGLDDLAEGQGHDGQVVAAQTEGGDTDDDTADSGHTAAHQKGDEEGHDTVAQRFLQKRGHLTADVGTHAHKSRVAQGKLTEEAHHQGQGHRQDDADGDLLQKEQKRAVQPSARHGDDREHDREDTDDDVVDIVVEIEFLEHYTFSLRFLPRKPVGRTSRMMMRMENSMASV